MSFSSPAPPNRRQSLAELWVYPLILLGILVIARLQIPELKRLTAEGQQVSPERYQREVQLEQLRLKAFQNLPAFGFDNLLADWVFLQFVQYFGDDDARAVTGYSMVPDYFKIVLKRDPRFRDAYYFLATGGTLYAGRAEETNALMEEGLKSVTPQVPFHSYYILRHKGINELLFLPNSQQKAQKTFEQAAEWAEIYNDEESQRAARASRSMAQYLENNPESKVAKVAAWGSVLQSVPDEMTQKRVIQKIRELGGEVSRTPEGQFQVKLPAKD
ncbi:hypothetical protein [Oscillatoria sp. FACHB-1406]|uniref:hypothetical protein n=1 Tax=Oscillatoria sp. FACHB-1406 TaxID=2692846 RepID=UPI0016875153|nr:hypothetical protein [Oscillatoria sp. FACHB-1406]MBD2577314.1 hypothetical protein [Oscillatoria sp. FACHB-1406]